MFSGFDFDVIQRSAGYLFREGMTFTVTLTLVAMAGGIFFGTLLAMMRLSKFGLLELTGRARAMQEFSFKVFEAFAAATVIYLLTTRVVVFAMRALERKVRVPGLISASPTAGGH